MRVVISERAEEDLARIYAWLALNHDLEDAELFRMRAEKALSHLRMNPGLGPHPAWATRHKSLRFWVISRTRYIIYYEHRGENIAIERILDGRRDVRRIMELGIENSPDQTE
jgi:plasmid stabilization system protein ParE